MKSHKKIENLDQLRPGDINEPIKILHSGAHERSETKREDEIRSILAMKKNLTGTFEKHAIDKYNLSDQVSDEGYVRPPVGRPKPRNMACEEQLPCHVPVRPSSVASAHSVDTESSSRSSSSSAINRASSSRRFLSVYLRIRPSSLSGLPEPSTVDDDTIEVLKNTASQHDSVDSICPTKVRTHPPVTSQAYKSIRQCPEAASKDHEHGAAMVDGIKEYKFQRVFETTTSQEDVYNAVAAPLIKGLFPLPISEVNSTSERFSKEGQSALIFAYGITNAGKTYTVMGKTGQENNKLSGMLPRALQDILDECKKRKSKSAASTEVFFTLRLSFFEIYNEHIFDLLCGSSQDSTKPTTDSFSRPSSNYHGSKQEVALKLREDRNGRIFVQGLTKHHVQSVSHGIELAMAAKRRRQTSSNNLNGESSRSHSICQLEVVQASSSGDEAIDGILQSRAQHPSMWIVDLAGSERTKRTSLMHGSKRQREAVQINTSLMNLMRCLHQLHHNQNSGITSSVGGRPTSGKGVVPFRGSKLSLLFMNHLTESPAGRTAMIVNVNPTSADFDETQHVLSYAAVARNVRVANSDYHLKMPVAASVSIQQEDEKHLHSEELPGGRKERSKARKRGMSPPKKIAKIAAKLSPRSFRCKKKTKGESNLDTINAESLLIERQDNPANSDVVRTHTGKRKLHNEIADHQQQKILQLHEENHNLSRAVEGLSNEVKKIRSDSALLRHELAQQESQIRIEVAEDWEEELRKMREFYEDARKQHQKDGPPTLSKSAKKVRLDKAEEQIDELMDKLEECEDEMNRMRATFSTEMRKSKQLHDSILLSKGRELHELLTLHQESMVAKDSEIQRLRERYESLIEGEQKSVQQGDDEIEFDSTDNSETDDDPSGELGTSSRDSEDESFENKSGAECASGAKRVRRLPRRRCSEVACAVSISPKGLQSTSQRGKIVHSINVVDKQGGEGNERVPLASIHPYANA